MFVRTMLRSGALVAAVVLTTVLGAVPAGAEPGWHATLLPLPDGAPDASGFLTGTDGKGRYSGHFYIGDGMQVITWDRGEPTLRGAPPGHSWPSAVEQNSVGTVLVGALDDETGASAIFTLDDQGYRQVEPPAGYTSASAVAINDRGDIVGTAWTDDSTKQVTVLWPVLGVGPVVIPSGVDVYPTDLDDDGTILFSSPGRGYLWRQGQVEDLAVPDGFDAIYASAIRNGAVVGYATSRTADVTGFLWSTPQAPKQLDGSGGAHAINKSGLIAGKLPPDLGSAYGPPAVWRQTAFLGKFPMPDGYARGLTYAVGDDGAIVGFASNRPLDEGGAPVVWSQWDIG
jgi:hypothetical protein